MGEEASERTQDGNGDGGRNPYNSINARTNIHKKHPAEGTEVGHFWR